MANGTGGVHSTPPIIPELKEYKINKHTKRGFQKRSADYIGNLILRAPTGSGKTDAALMWAQSNQKKNGRVFYVLPNRASINSMYLRLKEYFSEENVGLLHYVASAIYSMRENDLDLDSRLARLSNKIKDDVVLLHSRFCRRDRNDIERKLGKMPLPKVLVSTQVVEVSLDIDFEQGFFEPAPIDALIQRLGRVNRFGKQSAAKVVVLTERLHSFKIYDPKIVERSLEELLKLPNPISEQELVEAVDRVYSDGYRH
jgi:CRISPR/Cas system-associated endonuclease/helicase Cas3